MPTKLPHNCEACSKLSASQAREKKCWEDKRCPDRRSYHRKKATTAIRRKEQRQNSAIGTITFGRLNANAGVDGKLFDLAIPDTYAAELCLWINRSNNTIHAIGARLYCGGVMTDRVSVIHCLGLTNAQVKQVGRSILLAMSAAHDNVPLPKFRAIVEFDASLCPLTDCHVY
jgi:hypothetical protein